MSKAEHFREKGYSYREISEILGISKGTCYLWLKNIQLNPAALERLKNVRDQARDKAHKSIRERIKKRDERIHKAAVKDFSSLKIDKSMAKLLCAVLYWSEGEKTTKRIAFTNSDPDMVCAFLGLFKRAFGVSNRKFSAVLHLHSYHNEKQQKAFWSKITGIPIEQISIYSKMNTGATQRENYPCCISIRYHDILIFKEIESYFKILVENSGV